MISSISGEIISVGLDQLTISINGLGFEVNVTKGLAAESHAGQSITLFTHLVVREDLLALYGFRTTEEKGIFLLLLGVGGVGPRTALGMLDVLSTDAIRRAVISEQSEIFSRAPGVGKVKPNVHTRVAAACTGSQCDLSSQAGKCSTFLCICGAFLSFNCGPM